MCIWFKVNDLYNAGVHDSTLQERNILHMDKSYMEISFVFLFLQQHTPYGSAPTFKDTFKKRWRLSQEGWFYY